MCLFTCRSATQRLEKRFDRNNGTLDLWKIYYKNNWSLSSVWYTDYINSPGYVYPDFVENSNLIGDGREINHGIHVYTSREKAREVTVWSGRRIVVRVSCKKRDLIDAGYSHDAVFSKIYISQAEWDRIFKTSKKEKK